ncbi:MAG: hypothetical protein A2X94_15140 [Bdellovibrionales bacterium GWB1_55_8]|nr:MAG: hypothetical protein A2X94_15140 [Bdellovibrionales bacterium GWB1_55_8]
MDLNLLRVLASFAEERTVLAAAQALRITPSAVSQALKRLENEVGLQLFVRSHKKLTLTYEGRRLLESVIPSFHGIQETMDELTNRKNNPTGVIRVGAPTEFAVNFLIPTFSSFAESYPNISLKVKLGSPRALIQGLLSNELDFAYCDDGPYFSTHRSTLAVEHGFKEELVMACSRSFFERHLSTGANFSALVKLRHVDYVEDHSAVNIWYKHHFKKTALRLDLALVSENVHALIRGIKQGLGLGMVPSYLVENDIRRGDVVVISTGRSELQNPIVLVQHQDRILPLREKLLISFVKKNGKNFGLRAQG